MPRRDVRQRDRSRPNVHLITCMVCGTTAYSSDIKRQWNGVLACTRAINGCYNERDVFDKPVKIGKDSVPRIQSPFVYDPDEEPTI